MDGQVFAHDGSGGRHAAGRTPLWSEVKVTAGALPLYGALYLKVRHQNLGVKSGTVFEQLYFEKTALGP